MARQYRIRPSEILNIDDEYTAFCFDEACAYISNQMEIGNEPNFDALELQEEINAVYSGHYSSPSEMYKALDAVMKKAERMNRGKSGVKSMTGGKLKWH